MIILALLFTTSLMVFFQKAKKRYNDDPRTSRKTKAAIEIIGLIIFAALVSSLAFSVFSDSTTLSGITASIDSIATGTIVAVAAYLRNKNDQD